MHELLCFLLYLGAIFSPNSYYESQIIQAEQANQPEINSIKQDQELANDVVELYTPDAQLIEIWDDITAD